ncbi:MAG: hypothetical protein P1U57_02880 [Oleibacter sp.]|nr:hypothetical protein [Thalassolituus sp.]
MRRLVFITITIIVAIFLLCRSPIDALPGIPDGIATAPDGTFWLTLFNKRSLLLDALSTYPWVREQIAKLPNTLIPIPAPYGFIVQLDQHGKVLQSLHDHTALMVRDVTSVQPTATGVYLGSLHSHAIYYLGNELLNTN